MSGEPFSVSPKMEAGHTNVLLSAPDAFVNISQFAFNTTSIRHIYQYELSFHPPVASVSLRRFLFYNTTNLSKIFPWFAYDGKSSVYSLLPFDTCSFDVFNMLASADFSPQGSSIPSLFGESSRQTFANLIGYNTNDNEGGFLADSREVPLDDSTPQTISKKNESVDNPIAFTVAPSILSPSPLNSTTSNRTGKKTSASQTKALVKPVVDKAIAKTNNSHIHLIDNAIHHSSANENESTTHTSNPSSSASSLSAPNKTTAAISQSKLSNKPIVQATEATTKAEVPVKNASDTNVENSPAPAVLASDFPSTHVAVPTKTHLNVKKQANLPTNDKAAPHSTNNANEAAPKTVNSTKKKKKTLKVSELVSVPADFSQHCQPLHTSQIDQMKSLQTPSLADTDSLQKLDRHQQQQQQQQQANRDMVIPDVQLGCDQSDNTSPHLSRLQSDVSTHGVLHCRQQPQEQQLQHQQCNYPQYNPSNHIPFPFHVNTVLPTADLALQTAAQSPFNQFGPYSWSHSGSPTIPSVFHLHCGVYPHPSSASTADLTTTNAISNLSTSTTTSGSGSAQSSHRYLSPPQQYQPLQGHSRHQGLYFGLDPLTNPHAAPFTPPSVLALQAAAATGVGTTRNKPTQNNIQQSNQDSSHGHFAPNIIFDQPTMMIEPDTSLSPTDARLPQNSQRQQRKHVFGHLSTATSQNFSTASPPAPTHDLISHSSGFIDHYHNFSTPNNLNGLSTLSPPVNHTTLLDSTSAVSPIQLQTLQSTSSFPVASSPGPVLGDHSENHATASLQPPPPTGDDGINGLLTTTPGDQLSHSNLYTPNPNLFDFPYVAFAGNNLAASSSSSNISAFFPSSSVSQSVSPSTAAATLTTVFTPNLPDGNRAISPISQFPHQSLQAATSTMPHGWLTPAAPAHLPIHTASGMTTFQDFFRHSQQPQQSHSGVDWSSQWNDMNNNTVANNGPIVALPSSHSSLGVFHPTTSSSFNFVSRPTTSPFFFSPVDSSNNLEQNHSNTTHNQHNPQHQYQHQHQYSDMGSQSRSYDRPLPPPPPFAKIQTSKFPPTSDFPRSTRYIAHPFGYQLSNGSLTIFPPTPGSTQIYRINKLFSMHVSPFAAPGSIFKYLKQINPTAVSAGSRSSNLASQLFLPSAPPAAAPSLSTSSTGSVLTTTLPEDDDEQYSDEASLVGFDRAADFDESNHYSPMCFDNESASSLNEFTPETVGRNESRRLAKHRAQLALLEKQYEFVQQQMSTHLASSQQCDSIQSIPFALGHVDSAANSQGKITSPLIMQSIHGYPLHSFLQMHPDVFSPVYLQHLTEIQIQLHQVIQNAFLTLHNLAIAGINGNESSYMQQQPQQDQSNLSSASSSGQSSVLTSSSHYVSAHYPHQIMHLTPVQCYAMPQYLSDLENGPAPPSTNSTVSPRHEENPMDILSLQTALSVIIRHCYLVYYIDCERENKRQQQLPATNRSLFELDSFVIKGSCMFRYPTDISRYFSLGAGVNNIFGSYSSLRFLEQGLSLHVDISSLPVLRRGQPLIDILTELSNSSLEEATPALYRRLRFFTAITTHLGHSRNKRVQLSTVGPRVRDVPPFERLEVNGGHVSMVEYFQEYYKIDINPNYFTFVIERGDGSFIHFPIEVLNVLGGKQWSEELTREQTTYLLNATATNPHHRLRYAFQQLQHLVWSIKYLKVSTAGSLNQYQSTMASSATFTPAHQHPDVPRSAQAVFSMFNPFPVRIPEENQLQHSGDDQNTKDVITSSQPPPQQRRRRRRQYGPHCDIRHIAPTKYSKPNKAASKEMKAILNTNPDASLFDLISPSQTFSRVPTRVLPTPTVLFRNTSGKVLSTNVSSSGQVAMSSSGEFHYAESASDSCPSPSHGFDTALLIAAPIALDQVNFFLQGLISRGASHNLRLQAPYSVLDFGFMGDHPQITKYVSNRLDSATSHQNLLHRNAVYQGSSLHLLPPMTAPQVLFSGPVESLSSNQSLESATMPSTSISPNQLPLAAALSDGTAPPKKVKTRRAKNKAKAKAAKLVAVDAVASATASTPTITSASIKASVPSSSTPATLSKIFSRSVVVKCVEPKEGEVYGSYSTFSPPTAKSFRLVKDSNSVAALLVESEEVITIHRPPLDVAYHIIDDWLSEIAATGRPTLVISILETCSPFYGYIKRLGETMHGVISQCTDVGKIHRHLRLVNGLPSYIDNILLKINTKLGGLNYDLSDASFAQTVPLLSSLSVPQENGDDDCGGLASNVPVMVIGMSVYSEPGMLSHSAFVATYNRSLTRYNNYIVQQPKPDPLTPEQPLPGLRHSAAQVTRESDVRDAIENLLTQFYTINRGFPQHVVIYRDGLSDTQIVSTMCVELPGIIAGAQKAFMRAYPASSKSYNPTITFLIAVKRHHVRFQPAPMNNDTTATPEPSPSRNLPGGTVIDTQVVRKDVSEFFLQAHTGALGTARSTFYQVCYCSRPREITLNSLQLLTYYLSWGHQRSFRATAVPTPVYYADLLCDRARLYNPCWDSSGPHPSARWSFANLHKNMDSKTFWL